MPLFTFLVLLFRSWSWSYEFGLVYITELWPRRATLLLTAAPQTAHIQQERYGQQDNVPAHWARETIELLRNETPEFIKPDLLPPDSSDPSSVDYYKI